MTQEEKQLLLKDICSRLPYGIKVQFRLPNYDTNCFDNKIGEVFEIGNVFTHVHCDGIDYLPNTHRIKPYLRPMSSMTEAERKEYESFFSVGEYACGGSLYGEEYEYIADDYDDVTQSLSLIDWLNKNMFDYRGLISMGLAIEAPEEMYKK